MKVLLIGSGAREHALAYLITKSDKLDTLFVISGNPGTDGINQKSVNVTLDLNDTDSLLTFCSAENIGLVIIGPEQPLSEGLTDILIEEGLLVFGPTQAAAELESSKSFAKQIMKEANIPTAKSMSFSNQDLSKALEYININDSKCVIKADGLAAGKGVLICDNKTESETAIKNMFDGKFGQAGKSILIEEFMEGVEISLFAICDGNDFIMLPASTDHKRVGEGDTGLNTGGMGAFAPTPYASENVLQTISSKIIQPLLNQMKTEGKPFIGCLFCGIMLTEEGPKVVEFNVRFGDPEIQAVSQLIEGDFLQLLESAASGELNKHAITTIDDKYACNVVLAAEGYPESYNKGMEITIADISCDTAIFHAGTKMIEQKLVTNGGRVLSVVGTGTTPDEAIDQAYLSVNQISFSEKYFRKDIAAQIRAFTAHN